MSKFELLILEDDPIEIMNLREALSGTFHLHITSSKEDAIRTFQVESIDLVILDIYIQGEPDGLDIAQLISVSDIDKKCPIIFLTNSQDRRVFEAAKRTFPTNFLIKPFNQLELMYGIELAIEKFIPIEDNYSWEHRGGAAFFNQSFLIKKRDKWFKVLPSEIVFIEVQGRYCKLVTSKGNFLIQTSMSKLLATNLNIGVFIQTHRNYAINTNHVKEFMAPENLIVMDNDQTVFLSVRLKDRFLAKFNLLK